LAGIPHSHLHKSVARRGPKVNCGVWDGAIKPKLVRLVCREILVWQVGVVVAVQARHGDFGGVVAEVQFTQTQRGGVVGADAVEADVLPVLDVRPHPLVVDHDDAAQVHKGLPSGAVN